MISRKKRYRWFAVWLVFSVLILIGGYFYFTDYYHNDNKYEFKHSTYIALDPKNDAIIQWQDIVLERNVRASINKKEGDIFLSDIWSCRELQLGRKIEDNALGRSEITGEIITDISNLEGLVNLEILNLDYHAITDISIIRTLFQLRELSLNGNRVQDLSVIASHPSLQILDLRNTHIKETELKHLASLEKLVMLYLDYGDIESLESLKDVRLVYLSARQNKISDISALENLDKSVMFQLHFRQNQIIDIKPLSQFKELNFLFLSDNKITDITPLRELKRVEHLTLGNNQINIIPDLSGMISLRTLDLSNNQISTEEWKKVKLPSMITKVYLTGNPITDIETERKYPHLEVIFD